MKQRLYFITLQCTDLLQTYYNWKKQFSCAVRLIVLLLLATATKISIFLWSHISKRNILNLYPQGRDILHFFLLLFMLLKKKNPRLVQTCGRGAAMASHLWILNAAYTPLPARSYMGVSDWAPLPGPKRADMAQSVGADLKGVPRAQRLRGWFTWPYKNEFGKTQFLFQQWWTLYGSWFMPHVRCFESTRTQKNKSIATVVEFKFVCSTSVTSSFPWGLSTQGSSVPHSQTNMSEKFHMCWLVFMRVFWVKVTGCLMNVNWNFLFFFSMYWLSLI